MSESNFFAHESAYVDEPCEIGAETEIWHFCHVRPGARIGRGCVLRQNCYVASGAVLGDNVQVQNHVSIYAGVEVEDDVFLGPSCVLTNISNPRSQVDRRTLCEKTLLRRGVTIGANTTVICGVELGVYAFVAAGSVVVSSAPAYAFLLGAPARQAGWISRHGLRLGEANEQNVMICPESGLRYREVEPGKVLCLDLDESAPLPDRLARSARSYARIKAEHPEIKRFRRKHPRL